MRVSQGGSGWVERGEWSSACAQSDGPRDGLLQKPSVTVGSGSMSVGEIFMMYTAI